MKAIGTGNLATGWILSFVRTLETPMKIIANGYDAGGAAANAGLRAKLKTKKIFKGELGTPKDIRVMMKRKW